MGRRSTSTTKSGKYMNPADQERKIQRKKELRKNKKTRQAVREASLRSKDPQDLLKELDQIDKLELKAGIGDVPHENALKERRRRATDSLSRVLKFYEKNDKNTYIETKKLWDESERRRQLFIADNPEPYISKDSGGLSLPDIPLPSDIPLPAERERSQGSGPSLAPTPPPGPVPPGARPIPEAILAALRANDKSILPPRPRPLPQPTSKLEDNSSDDDDDGTDSDSAMSGTESGSDVDGQLKPKKTAKKSIKSTDETTAAAAVAKPDGKVQGQTGLAESALAPPLFSNSPLMPPLPSMLPQLNPFPPPPPPPSRMSIPSFPLYHDESHPMQPAMAPPPPPPPPPPPMSQLRPMIYGADFPSPGSLMPPPPPRLLPPPPLHPRLAPPPPLPGSGMTTGLAKTRESGDGKGQATISAAPQLRDTQAEVTKFMPTSLRIRREQPRLTSKPKLKSTMDGGMLVSRDRPTFAVPLRKGTAVSAAKKDEAYAEFMKEMEGLL